jgi:hypothetical protein
VSRDHTIATHILSVSYLIREALEIAITVARSSGK